MESGRLLTRTFRLLLCQPIFWCVLGYGLLPVLASGSELMVMIQPGIDPKRNHELEDHWTTQLARSLPPESSPYMLTVQGPDGWLPDEPPAGSGEVGALNAEHAEVLRAAMDERDLLSKNDPLLLAGRVVALLRPLEIDGASAPARHVRLRPLWELFAYSVDADTLSVALAVVQTLEGAGISGRIARYPAATGSFRFGVLLPGAAAGTSSVPWAQRVGADFLLPAALSATPVTDLQPDEVNTWTWQQVVAPGWIGSSGNGDKHGVKEDPVDQKTRKAASPPDLCRQAEALGFECVPAGSGPGRAQALLVISALTLILLVGWLALRFKQHRLRLVKARIRRLFQEAGRF